MPGMSLSFARQAHVTLLLLLLVRVAPLRRGGGLAFTTPRAIHQSKGRGATTCRLAAVRADSDAVVLDAARANEVAARVQDAIAARAAAVSRWAASETSCYRVFHGTIEGVEGLTIDRYGAQLLLQTFREPLFVGDAG